MGGLLVLVIVLGVWLGFAYWSMRMAEDKGYGAGTWFILGLLLGFWALIVLLLLPDHYEPDVYHHKSRQVICPRCKAAIDRQPVCPNCGLSLTPGVPTNEPRAVVDENWFWRNKP
jgi:hypothetical protein